MKKTTAQTILKLAGVLFYIGTVGLVLLSVVFFANVIPELNTELVDMIDYKISSDLNLNVLLGIVVLVFAIFTAFKGWALRRAGKKNQTTLALILTALTLIGSVVNLFGTKQMFSQLCTILVDALLFFSVITIRKDVK